MTEFEFKYANSEDFYSEITDFLSYNQIIYIKNKSKELSPKERQIIHDWTEATEQKKRLIIMEIVDQLETTCPVRNNESVFILMLISQGLFNESATDISSHYTLMQQNCLFLIECDLFTSLWDFILIQIGFLKRGRVDSKDQEKRLFSINLSLIVMHTFIEIVRNFPPCLNDREQRAKEHIIECLIVPSSGEVVVQLWKLLIDQFGGKISFLPVTKILIMLWKGLTLVLGDIMDYHQIMNKKRVEFGLDVWTDNIHEIADKMTTFPTKSPVDAERAADIACNTEDQYEDLTEIDDFFKSPKPRKFIIPGLNFNLTNDKVIWRQKISYEKYCQHVRDCRAKFFGFKCNDDNLKLSGLPQGLKHSLSACEQFIYTPIADVQRKKFKDYIERPFTEKCQIDQSTPAWRLYKAISPSIDTHMSVLLKLAFVAFSDGEEDSNLVVNLNNDIAAEDTVFSNFSIEQSRIREIMGKAVSSILLLLLKYFKLSHIYKFETICYQLMLDNVMSILLLQINRDPAEHIYLINELPDLKFPLCCFSWCTPDLDKTCLSWRNCFTTINVLRIMNKVVKHKPWRIINIVGSKSFISLVRILRVGVPLLQLFALKLLKMQWKYLTRHWRKNNIRVMSLISLKLRVLINDDWNSSSVMAVESRDNELREEMVQFNSVMCGGKLPCEFMTEMEEKERIYPQVIVGDIARWLAIEVFDDHIDWTSLLQSSL